MGFAEKNPERDTFLHFEEFYREENSREQGIPRIFVYKVLYIHILIH